MFLKIHHTPGIPDVVAVCDRELLNTTLIDEKRTVRIHDSFYGTTLVSEEEVRSALEKTENINLMGERAVNVAIFQGILTRAECIMIGNVPHAQIYRI